jgi:hypothetical protein
MGLSDYGTKVRGEGAKVRRWKAKRDHSTMGLSDHGTKVRGEGARPDRSAPSRPAAGEKRQGTAALQDASRPSSAPGQRPGVGGLRTGGQECPRSFRPGDDAAPPKNHRARAEGARVLQPCRPAGAPNSANPTPTSAGGIPSTRNGPHRPLVSWAFPRLATSSAGWQPFVWRGLVPSGWQR